VALLVLFLVSQSACAEEEKEPQWIPSLNFGFDTFRYDATSTVENFVNPPVHSGKQTGSKQELLFQLGGELQGPRFGGVPGRPRLFVAGGFGLTPFSSDAIFETGVIGEPEGGIEIFKNQLALAIDRGCENQRPPNCNDDDPQGFDGQGSRITSSFLNPSWYASLGVAFDIPVSRKLLFQIKPSVAYSGENIEMVGNLTTVTKPAPGTYEVTRSIASTGVTDHSLGMGLELALDLFRATRPITSAIYVDLRLLWLLSDPTTTFADDAGVASYEVTRNTFGIRGGAGLRFSWKGSGGD